MTTHVKDIDMPYRVVCIDKNGVEFFFAGAMTRTEAISKQDKARKEVADLGLKNVKYEARAHP